MLSFKGPSQGEMKREVRGQRSDVSEDERKALNDKKVPDRVGSAVFVLQKIGCAAANSTLVPLLIELPMVLSTTRRFMGESATWVVLAE